MKVRLGIRLAIGTLLCGVVFASGLRNPDHVLRWVNVGMTAFSLIAGIFMFVDTDMRGRKK